jgi:hypothetical protein
MQHNTLTRWEFKIKVMIRIFKKFLVGSGSISGGQADNFKTSSIFVLLLRKKNPKI